jgi:hypothetical protein
MANPMLERYPALRRATNRPQVRRIARLQRFVRERTRFVSGELRGGTYGLAIRQPLPSHPAPPQP